MIVHCVILGAFAKAESETNQDSEWCKCKKYDW